MWYFSQLGAWEYALHALAFIGVGFMLGDKLARATDGPILVLLAQTLRDVQKAHTLGHEIPTALALRIEALVGKPEVER